MLITLFLPNNYTNQMFMMNILHELCCFLKIGYDLENRYIIIIGLHVDLIKYFLYDVQKWMRMSSLFIDR